MTQRTNDKHNNKILT